MIFNDDTQILFSQLAIRTNFNEEVLLREKLIFQPTENNLYAISINKINFKCTIINISHMQRAEILLLTNFCINCPLLFICCFWSLAKFHQKLSEIHDSVRLFFINDKQMKICFLKIFVCGGDSENDVIWNRFIELCNLFTRKLSDLLSDSFTLY